MKLLLRYFYFSIFFFPIPSKSQDSAFILKGKLLQPSTISSLIIFYPIRHMDNIPIQSDGTFFYKGNFSEPGEMQIATRESSITIWLDTGLKYLYLSGKPNRNGKVVLTIDSILGSDDTYLYYHTRLPRSIKIDEPKLDQYRRFSSIEQINAYTDSLNKARKPYMDSLRRVNSFHEIDSIFNIRPGSKVLPWLIRFYSPALGIDLMQELYYRLSIEQQQSISGKKLLNELNKLQLLKPGNIFEDFTMKDDHDKKFQFKSLRSKYVLIDFWASWCGPCRSNHPFLREAYQKSIHAGLEIISISMDNDKQKWINAIKEDTLPWINVSDLRGRDNAIAVKYKITGIPFSVLLNEERKVIMVNPNSYQIIEFFKNLVP